MTDNDLNSVIIDGELKAKSLNGRECRLDIESRRYNWDRKADEMITVRVIAEGSDATKTAARLGCGEIIRAIGRLACTGDSTAVVARCIEVRPPRREAKA